MKEYKEKLLSVLGFSRAGNQKEQAQKVNKYIEAMERNSKALEEMERITKKYF